MLAKIEGGFEQQQAEVHSLKPWWIARYNQQLERTALHHLLREGFECFSPTYRDVRQQPLRKVPPKKRKNAAMFLVQVRKKRFPGYVFIRRAFGHFDINRLFDLRGCGSIVTVSGQAALVADYDIELMRLAETDGRFDVYQLRGMPLAYFKVETLEGDSDLKKQWDTQGPLRMPLAESKDLSLTVDAFGRVSHLIAHADRP